MRDPYQILGVSRTASEADIKKAYRRLAKTHHPDQNTSDSKAAARFSEINQAYEIVGDKAKRAQFDRGEIDGDGKPRFAGMGAGPGGARTSSSSFDFDAMRGARRGGPGFDPNDLFSDLFGAMRGHAPGQSSAHAPPTRGTDAQLSVSVPFADAILGGKARITLPSGKSLDVAIPAGTSHGQTMRLKGQGYPSPVGGPAGDALVTIDVRPHPVLRLDGIDLRLELPVTLDEAVLGAKIRVPTLEGAVDITIPGGSNSGTTLRLRAKGAPKGSSRGDLFVTLRVVLPENPAALESVCEEIRARAPYSVRSKDYSG